MRWVRISAMKRELEDRAEKLLEYLFPKEERDKWNLEQQLIWAGHARSAAGKIIEAEIESDRKKKGL